MPAKSRHPFIALMIQVLPSHVNGITEMFSLFCTAQVTCQCEPGTQLQSRPSRRSSTPYMSISSIRQRIHELKVHWIHTFDKLLTYLSTTVLLLCGGVKHYPEKHIIDMRLLSPLGEVCHRQSQDTVTVTLK